MLENVMKTEILFDTPEEAWYWCMGEINRRKIGNAINSTSVVRPCTPDDIIKCLDRLYRQRRIQLKHARILRIYGEKNSVPENREEYLYWKHAIDELGYQMRIRRYVK
jgi:hypothetical protein